MQNNTQWRPMILKWRPEPKIICIHIFGILSAPDQKSQVVSDIVAGGFNPIRRESNFYKANIQMERSLYKQKQKRSL